MLMYSIKTLQRGPRGLQQQENGEQDVDGAGSKEDYVKDDGTRRWMRGNVLEACGRDGIVSPWVFLSGLQGSRHNSLNWFLLLCIQDKQQGDFFLFNWVKGRENFPLQCQQTR